MLLVVLFCFAKKVPKKAPRKRCTSRFREGASIDLCATVVNSSGSLMGNTTGNSLHAITRITFWRSKKVQLVSHHANAYPLFILSSISKSNFLAVSFAISYPASAWRITPMPGSLRNTRFNLCSASSLPSATITMPACML
jgi:hypothetical protein